MFEFVLVITALSLVYLLIPSCWIDTFFPEETLASEASTVHCAKAKMYVPEDAVLRRHFINHLRMEIEAGLHPRPVDSVLQRHYDTLVEAKLAVCLAEFGSLQPC